VGHGTQFRVFLPARVPSLPESQPAVPQPIVAEGQGELILVVDDETFIRQIIRETLEDHGYRVYEAGDGVEAVTLFVQQRAQIKAVITDMCMPIMDGRSTVSTLRHIDPEVRIIVITGADPLAEKGSVNELGIKGFLNKPFSSEQLLVTLKQVLADSKATERA
jgi:CheY-like chemotaxis protein